MIYDYIECQKILDNLDNTIIKETTPIGYTSLEILPIRHFTLGQGEKHIVVTASQHSNEIISTTFVLMLMKHLINNNIIFENLTIHFIPILNPEGYIVNTSAIMNKLSKNNSYEKTIKFCYDFYQKYKIDNITPLKDIKLHQLMFNDTNYKCIDSNYKLLKEQVKEILSNHPKGSIIDWASNGHGIDLNSNSINKQVREFEYNKQKPYNNIRLDIPSPIGYPGQNNNLNFKEEIEISSLKKLFNELNKNNNLLGYFNYHSIGGLIYQRPETDNLFFTTYNYLLSKFYQEHTIKNNNKYQIITNKENKITSVNDTLRITYPGNLLIELSPMMGNPIGVFGDINNFNTTINSNIASFIYTMNNLEDIYNTTEEIITKVKNIDKVYDYIDDIYHLKRKTLTK